MASEVTLPSAEHIFNRLFPSSTPVDINNCKMKRPANYFGIFFSRYAELHPGGSSNKLVEATGLWNSMTDDEKQPWRELAIQVKRLHMATFPDQPRTRLRNVINDRLGPSSLKLGQTGQYSRNVNMIQPTEVLRDPILQYPVLLPIEDPPPAYSLLDYNVPSSPTVGRVHPTDPLYPLLQTRIRDETPFINQLVPFCSNTSSTQSAAANPPPNPTGLVVNPPEFPDLSNDPEWLNALEHVERTVTPLSQEPMIAFFSAFY